MSASLEEYRELLEPFSAELRESARAAWGEASRVLSPRGLDNYLKGAAALAALGRNDALVATWIEAAPAIAKEVGEDVLGDLAQTALAMASKTSAKVIELLLATAPTAAMRLGDDALFRAYLQFVHTLLAQAPRGLRPLLDNLDTLLGQLTLGGLRRWALWGAHAHRADFDAQSRYFGLDSKESLAMLQQERKGTLFVDIQRRINIYLRALWGRDFFMRPTSGDFETRAGCQPFVEDYFIHLPDAYDDFQLPSPASGREENKVSGVELYRAAAAHCAAHLVETRAPISAEALNPLQMAVIGVVEDARVETLAMRRFPGLRRVWARFHTADATRGNSMGDYLDRLARALLDPGYRDPDPWVAQGRALFAQARERLQDNKLSWEIGVQLAHAIQAKGLAYNPRGDVQSVPYRDDNRYFWAFEEYDLAQAAAAGYETVRQARKHVGLMEFVNELDVETAGDDAEEIWVLGTELFPYEDRGKSYNELEGREPVSDPYHYAEWDYQIQLERPAWATVLEKRGKLGDLQLIDDIAAQHKRLIARMKFLLDAMQPQGVTRLRKLEDGDDIDLNAALDGMVDLRLGMQPDPRIMMRSVRKVRDIAVLVLLDLSESTNDKVAGQEFSVLELTRQATVLLADAIHKVGDPFAIHGFCSDGRHNVEYLRFKDFDQPYNEIPKARLAGMSGQLSTRMGAAIRHAAHHLKQQKSAKKLLLVITDGEPADVDVRDPQYLRLDAKKAVEQAARHGVITYCMSLDPRADQYVARIFGQRNYMVVDHVARLPERLPLLYAGLTR